MAVERILSKQPLGCSNIIEIIRDTHLLKSVVDQGNYYPQFVREFIVNLASINIHNSPNFHNLCEEVLLGFMS